MSITSIDELEGVPVGAYVRVDGDRSQIFQRIPKGFARDGVTINTSAFAAALKAGLVEPFDAAINPGDWLQNISHANHYCLVLACYGSRWWVLYVYNGSFYSLGTTTLSDLLSMTKVDGPPYDADLSQVLLAFGQQQARDTSPSLSEAQVADLHDYAAETDDPGFDDLLHTIGLGRGADHAITLTITGTSTVKPDKEQAGSLLGAEYRVGTVADESVTITWTRIVTLTKYGIGCTCDQVTETEVALYLPPGTTAHEWSVGH